MTAAFAAGSLAAVGIASASAPQKIPDSTTGVITACMVKKTGAVRFINAQAGKTCTAKEKKVTFNRTGPPGAPGPAGPQGPSAVFVDDPDGWLGLPVGTADTTIASVKVPAGDYLLSAQTTPWITNAATTSFVCTFTTTSGTLAGDPSAWNPAVAAVSSMPMGLTGTVKGAAADTTITLSCKATGHEAAALAGAVLTATRVGEVSEQ
jgi:hypothetical protein